MLPTEEKRLLLVLAALVVAVTAAFSALSALEIRKVRRVEEEVAAVEKELTGLRAKAGKIPLLESDVGLLRARSPEYRDALPPVPFEDSLVKGVQAQATLAKVRILGIRPEKSPGTDRRRGNARSGRETVAFRIETRGGFFSLLRFMNLLELYPRLLSLKEGKFSEVKDEDRSVRRDTGIEERPTLQLSILLEAYSEGRETGKEDVHGTGPVFEKPVVPESRKIISKDRMNPFVVRLSPAKRSAGDSARLESPDEAQARRLLQSWSSCGAVIRSEFAGGSDIRGVFLAMQELVKTIDRTVLPQPLDEERKALLGEWTGGETASGIREAYCAWVVERVRSSLLKMQMDHHGNRPLEAMKGFGALLEALAPGLLVPEQARPSFNRMENVFLEAALVVLQEQGDARAVLGAIDAVEKAIPEDFRKDPLFTEFLPELERRRKLAGALVEFFDMCLVVSGLFWVPDDSKAKRIAIVNGRAVQEGERVPPDAVGSKKNRSIPEAVVLSSVGRDRWVRFGYKGLSIRVALGSRGKDRLRD